MRGSLKHVAAAGAALACAALAPGCLSGRSVAERVIDRFVTAVQARDLDTLRCLLAGGEDREAFDGWARARYEEYLAGRDRGGVDLGDDGLTLVKAFALGRGTFYKVASAAYGGDGTLTVRTEVRFGYGQANYGTFSPGTTFYLAGDPPGSIVSVTVPRSADHITREVLEAIDLEWELVRVDDTPGCSIGWVVASVRPVPGSESIERVTWVF